MLPDSIICSFEFDAINFQCGSFILSEAFGPPHELLIIVIKFAQTWIFTLVQLSFISLSITRMVLIFKVGNVFLLFKAMNQNIFLFQPTEFNQLNHERRFKKVLAALLSGTSIYSLAVLTFTHWIAAGST